MKADLDMKRVEEVMAQVEATIKETNELLERNRHVRKQMKIGDVDFETAMARLPARTRDRIVDLGERMARAKMKEAMKVPAKAPRQPRRMV